MTDRHASESDRIQLIWAAAFTIMLVAPCATYVAIQPAQFHGRLEISPSRLTAAMQPSFTSSGGNVTFVMEQASYLDIDGTIPSYWMIAARGG